MQITLITDGSSKAYKMIEELDKTERAFEIIEDTQRKNLPVIIIDGKEMDIKKALRRIRKAGEQE